MQYIKLDKNKFINLEHVSSIEKSDITDTNGKHMRFEIRIRTLAGDTFIITRDSDEQIDKVWDKLGTVTNPINFKI